MHYLSLIMDDVGDEESIEARKNVDDPDGQGAETSENLLDELHNLFTKRGGSGFGSYTQDMAKRGFSPDNAYSHAWNLISSSKKDIEIDKMNVLNDPQIILGNIENEKSLRYYQNDLYFLTNLCNMAINDPMFKGVFEVLWQNFKNEVRITSCMGGTERQYQAFHIPQASTKRGFSLFGRRKKQQPKNVMDYVIPQESEEDMY